MKGLGMATVTTQSAPVTARRRFRRSHVQFRSSVLLGGIELGAVLVMYLWWQGTPAIHGLGDRLTNAGRITGLLGGYAAAVLLLLMARVPAIEHGVGADRLARWHSFGGRYTVLLLSAHTLLIIWGYAVTAHTSLTRQTTDLLFSDEIVAILEAR